jgi:hypothetical protein
MGRSGALINGSSGGQHSQSTRQYALQILQMSGQSSAYTVSENLEVTELDE